MENQQILELKVPRDNEYTPENMAACFSGLAHLPGVSFFSRLLGKKPTILSFEIGCFDQRIHFYVVSPLSLVPYLESQILAQYPLCLIEKAKEFSLNFSRLKLAQMVLTSAYYYPLKTYLEFKEVDPLSSILGVMSKARPTEEFLVQTLLRRAGDWQEKARILLQKGKEVEPGKTIAYPDKGIIGEKISQPGFATIIRIAASSDSLLSSLSGAFGAFTRGDGNSLSLRKPQFWQREKFEKAVRERSFAYSPKYQVLNIEELATLWHLPNKEIKVPNIAWTSAFLSEPPENLPVATDLSKEEKQKINFLGRTEFKNRMSTFGIKKEDRRRHLYIIGKTGVGKTTLIANMAIADMRNGEGVAVIDPHGDLCEILLDFIPSFRLNDVCYFNPADRERPVKINPLEVKNPPHAELVASGIISIFHKLYAYSWGPRLEYILRNSLLTLVQVPNSTLNDVLRILTDERFRERVVDRLEDKVLKNFWVNEFGRMPPRLKEEAISPILNKVGQFVSSPLIRNIIESPYSTVDLEETMNQGKILLVNLSQGRLGEDNSSLLGSMLITKLQLAAMNRVNVPEEERRDFYLFVDEFQNFATTSFIKILSEARKYRLNIILANQYMAQISKDVQAAILGNAGTLISFLVGAEDARILSREFGEEYEESDLVGLSNYQILVKLAIRGLTSRPFFAQTLPLPKSKNLNREKVIRVSRERFGR